jgi:hypothetical protein
MARLLGALTRPVCCVLAFLFLPQQAGVAQQPVAAVTPTPTPGQRSESTRRPLEPSATATVSPSNRSEHRGNDGGATPTGTSTTVKESTHRSPDQARSDESSPQKYMQNLRRWQSLSPEEREALRRQQRYNQEQREKSSNDAYQRSGLRLNDEQRTQFQKRYTQERKKLEEQLLRETQEKRQTGNAAIIEQLKKEFAAAQTPNPAPTAR